LVIDPMESISANAVSLIPTVGNGINKSFWWKCAMKTSIEYGDLRDVREQLLDQFNAFESSLVVQRSDGSYVFDLLLYFRCDAHRLRQLGASVNNAMAHNSDVGSRLQDSGGP